MQRLSAWRAALVTAIASCLEAIDEGNVDEADGYLELEEILGQDQADMLEHHDILGLIGTALILYCHAAQHDQNEVLPGLLIRDVRVILTKSRMLLEDGKDGYHSGLEAFRG